MTTPMRELVARALEDAYDRFDDGTPLRDMWPEMASAAILAMRPVIEAAFGDGENCVFVGDSGAAHDYAARIYAARIIAELTAPTEEAKA